MKTSPDPLRPKTILIPVDGSSQAEEAVRSIQAWSIPERVLLLHTISIPQLAYPGTGMSVGHDFSEAAEKTLRQEGSRILEKAASLLPAKCGQISQHLEIGNPASIILSMAQQQSVDLIIMGSRGLGAIKEHVIGSVSHRVATHAPCHVLLIKAPVFPLKSILLPIEHSLDAGWAIEFLSHMPFQGMPRLTEAAVLAKTPRTHSPTWDTRWRASSNQGHLQPSFESKSPVFNHNWSSWAHPVVPPFNDWYTEVCLMRPFTTLPVQYC
jgi:nucleotide-binding universal stress UspA family protein